MYPKASIRGNIIRFIKNKSTKIKRVGRGIYSVIEVISVENGKVNYSANYYADNKEIYFYHTGYTNTSDIKRGIYERKTEFNSFEEMKNHNHSLQGIIQMLLVV